MNAHITTWSSVDNRPGIAMLGSNGPLLEPNTAFALVVAARAALRVAASTSLTTAAFDPAFDNLHHQIPSQIGSQACF